MHFITDAQPQSKVVTMLANIKNLPPSLPPLPPLPPFIKVSHKKKEKELVFQCYCCTDRKGRKS